MYRISVEIEKLARKCKTRGGCNRRKKNKRLNKMIGNREHGKKRKETRQEEERERYNM